MDLDWPWEDTAQATIVLPRAGDPRQRGCRGKTALVKSGVLTSTPPVWQVRALQYDPLPVNGQWKIAGMKQTQIILEPEPTPAPTLSPQ